MDSPVRTKYLEFTNAEVAAAAQAVAQLLNERLPTSRVEQDKALRLAVQRVKELKKS